MAQAVNHMKKIMCTDPCQHPSLVLRQFFLDPPTLFRGSKSFMFSRIKSFPIPHPLPGKLLSELSAYMDGDFSPVPSRVD
jgi:hypothetical protein